jgi:hypothetical protein
MVADASAAAAADGDEAAELASSDRTRRARVHEVQVRRGLWVSGAGLGF